MTNHTFPYLDVLVLLPLFGAALVAIAARTSDQIARSIALAVSLLELVVAVLLLVHFKTGSGAFQFTSHHSYASALGITWNLGIDGISLFLVQLTALLIPIVLLGTSVKAKGGAYAAWMLVLEAATIMSFVALDLMVFFVAFELTLIPSYFLIAGYGHERRAFAAVKFFIMTFLGSAFLLIGIIYLGIVHQHQTGGPLTFALGALAHTHLSSGTAIVVSLAFLAAFAVKAPLFPLHTWSPDAYREAPAGASMVLSAVLAKLGTYGIIRFNLTLFPHASKTLAPLVLTLAVIGIIYGATVACAQKDMKRLVAYSSLAQVGFIALGTFAFTSQGLTGAVVMMLNHGLITAAFFLVIGWIYERRGTWQVGELKGLQGPAPILAAVFTIVMLASIGLPGLTGFVGEFLVLLGTFLSHRWWAVVATTGVVIAAMYLLWAYQQAFHGKAEGANATTADLTVAERLIVAPLLILIVVLGVYPNLVIARITPSVARELAPIVQTTTGVYHRAMHSIAISGRPSGSDLDAGVIGAGEVQR